MAVLLLLALILIGAIIIIAKKVSNKLLRYPLILLFSMLIAGIIWIMWVAVKSGEM